MAKMMKIKILSPCFQNGKLCKKGDVVEVPEGAGREAIWLKKAEAVVEESAAPAAPGSNKIKKEKE